MCEALRWVVVRAGEIEVPTCIAGHVVNLTHAHVGVYSASCGADDPEPPGWNPLDITWIPRARILIDIEDADAAFDAGYWVDVTTYPSFPYKTNRRRFDDGLSLPAWPDFLEVTIPRTALQGPDEIPIPAWRLDEIQARYVVSQSLTPVAGFAKWLDIRVCALGGVLDSATTATLAADGPWSAISNILFSPARP